MRGASPDKNFIGGVQPIHSRGEGGRPGVSAQSSLPTGQSQPEVFQLVKMFMQLSRSRRRAWWEGAEEPLWRGTGKASGPLGKALLSPVRLPPSSFPSVSCQFSSQVFHVFVAVFLENSPVVHLDSLLFICEKAVDFYVSFAWQGGLAGRHLIFACVTITYMVCDLGKV